MSDKTFRVRIVKGADLTMRDTILSDAEWIPPTIGALVAHRSGFADEDFTVLDETPGIFLEGVTAEDVKAYLLRNERPAEPGIERAYNALRKAAES